MVGKSSPKDTHERPTDLCSKQRSRNPSTRNRAWAESETRLREGHTPGDELTESIFGLGDFFQRSACERPLRYEVHDNGTAGL